MAEFRQLSFELPGLVEQAPDKRAPRGRRRLRPVAELPRSLFDVTPPPAAPAARGLQHDGELTEKCRALVASLGLRSLAVKVDVFWNTRLVTTAGLAHHGSSRIDLNPRLERFAPEEPRRTLLHELAHLVAHQRASGRRIQPHGSEWRRACAELGIPGEQRCHNLPLARRPVRRKFAYQCPHCGIVVPRVRKLGRESACYPCCREHNRGRYCRRFLLWKISLDRARELAPEHVWGE
jgi:SprT protein